MNGRERILRTLGGRSPDRAPRDLWFLPWADMNYPEFCQKLRAEYPKDFSEMWAALPPSPVRRGDPYVVGDYVDEWGCVWSNIHPGIVGEVKHPIVSDEEWEDWENVHIPEEQLLFDIEEANGNGDKTKFRLAGCLPRPFEQLQFIRGTENLYIDLMMRPKKMFEFIEKMHDFYTRLVEKWCKTDCDGIYFMDDWGSQNSLLISPALFDEIFLPMYRTYIDLAHKHGKKAFMHSDGYILSILPKLIDAGLDAINCQIFCMGVDKLKQFRGKITFWGEIDRQHLLPKGTPEDIRNAVRSVYENLWDGGHCIAQCEIGPGAKPDNILEVYRTWDKLTTTQGV